MFELIGLLGGALFAVGCMPVAWQSIKTGKSVGTPLTTMWLLAVSLMLYSIYLFGTFGAHLPFWFMIVELICWSIALWYHYFPRHGGWSSNRVRKAVKEASDRALYRGTL